VNSDSNGVIPFIIRTHWGYTQWTRISFSFLAEGSSQIEAGYYQIDTASLSSCNSGKSIAAFIPLTSQNPALSAALTFLNGFEISSVSVNASYLTPFEVEVVVNSVTKQGISVLLQSTTATQVHSIFVSYVAYDPIIQNLVAGSYVYNKYVPSSSLQFTPPIGVSGNNVAFHGFNGFIANNNRAALSLAAALVKGNLTFASSSNFYYLSYNYFFLIGGPCGQCVGYTISYNGNCVATCPPSSYYNGVTCVTCTSAQVWDGTKCVAIPPPPAPTPTTTTTTTSSSSSSSSSSSTSLTGAIPSCPGGTYWDQQQLRCLPCSSGCASCLNCDSCITCSVGFSLNAAGLCSEVCGDGKRFVLPCDDGNTISGDGCSSTCQVENGYFCTGGAPASKDVCSKSTPSAISLSSSGQSHQWGKIVLNVRVNHLPAALISSANDCANSCRNVLSVKIVSGDSSAVSILATYIPTSSYSFSVIIDFQKEPIGLFTAQIGINPALTSKYFSGVDTSNQLTVNVNPAFLSLATDTDSSAILN
jgi:cysteine-rich repeat protein